MTYWCRLSLSDTFGPEICVTQTKPRFDKRPATLDIPQLSDHVVNPSKSET